MTSESLDRLKMSRIGVSRDIKDARPIERQNGYNLASTHSDDGPDCDCGPGCGNGGDSGDGGNGG